MDKALAACNAWPSVSVFERHGEGQGCQYIYQWEVAYDVEDYHGFLGVVMLKVCLIYYVPSDLCVV